jgi:hypothetical protein
LKTVCGQYVVEDKDKGNLSSRASYRLLPGPIQAQCRLLPTVIEYSSSNASSFCFFFCFCCFFETLQTPNQLLKNVLIYSIIRPNGMPPSNGTNPVFSSSTRHLASEFYLRLGGHLIYSLVTGIMHRGKRSYTIMRSIQKVPKSEIKRQINLRVLQHSVDNKF